PGTIPRKIDLWKITDGEDWKRFNLSATSLNHKGKEAIRLEASGGDGLALFGVLELPTCKLDLSIAGVNQKVGLIVRAKDQNSYELVSFDVAAEAGKPKLTIGLGSRSAEVELPSHLLGEWIGVRVVVDKLFTAVFVNGKNMPDLKVPSDGQTSNGSLIGLWVGGNSAALVADLKYIQSKKRDFE
ncbi:MAG: hypothetical protein ACRD82_19455, partial [Blastocatellia bacterium]